MRVVTSLTALILGLGTISVATADVSTANFEFIYNPYMESRNFQLPETDLSKSQTLQDYDVAERNFIFIYNPSMQQQLPQIPATLPASDQRLEQGDIFEANFNYIENPSRKWEL
ncbi:MAG: hypothetical protein V7731_00440 [Amphritea sp.]